MNGEVQLIVKKQNAGGVVLDSGFILSAAGPTSPSLQIPGTYQPPSGLDGCTLTLVNGINGCTDTVTNITAAPFVGGSTLVSFPVGSLACTYTAIGNTHTYSISTPFGNNEEAFNIDLFENESISQNWKFQDLSNFTAQGAFTREFRVPFSDNNQKALGALFDVNVDAGSNNYFHYKLPAEIRVDTLPIATGYVRVRKVYKTMNRISEVELAFYAETPDLVRNIGEKKLSEIVDLPSLNEEVSYVNVTTPSAQRVWTILDRGQLWSEGGEANTRSLQDPATPVYPADLTPALNWWYLFNQIITDAGFDLVAGSLQNILETYYMPWCNSRYLQGSDTTGEFGFKAEVGTNFFTNGHIPFDVEIYDNLADFNPATFTYTAPASGIYTFNLNLFIDKNAGSARVFIQAIINVTNVENVIDANFFENTTWNFSHSLTLNAGDSVRWFTFKQGASTTRIMVGSSIQLQTANLFYSQDIFYPLNAPDMKQIDFVTDVIKMHNCAIVPDRAIPNKVYIVPQNSYLGSGAVVDWTGKLDTAKDIVIGSTTDLQKGKFQFTYTAGEDIISKVYRNVDRIYGDYEAIGYTVNPDTLPSDFAIGEQKISLVTRSTPAGVVNGSGYIMPMFLNDSLQFVAPGPRCLFLAGSWVCQLYDEGTSAPGSYEVFTLNNYSVINAEIDDEDLNWAPEIPPHTIVSNPYNNLFNKYWRTYMNALYSPEARMMEAHFALTLSDILTFSFADKIWIQDSYWRIIEITDYKVGMYESTKVKLLKFLEDVEDCTGTPISISLNGQVNFEDAGGDPVAPSQDCCVRYGYTWDENLGVCWANVPTSGRPNSPTSGSATNPAPRRTAVQTRNAQITDSVINGEDVTIANGNKDMLAVGQRLELTKDVQGSTMLGKNVYTNLPGIHVGGGFRGGNPANITYTGWAQFGQFTLQRLITAPSSGSTFDLYIEGVAGEYIELADESVWSVIMNVSVSDTAGSETSLHHFTLDKFAGIANASAITTLSTSGAIGAYVFTFAIDTATNTDQHRINVTVTGGAYPAAFLITASIQYQQSKTST